MATLPKLYFNGKRVKTFKYNGVEMFESNYKDGIKDIVKCYHKHKGIAGQSSANGCYTVKELYGGSCPGHYWKKVQWHCGACGTKISGNGAACSNPACSHHDSGGGGDWAETIDSGYNYHNTASQCDSWRWQTRYILGCGYGADDGT